jgi:hypothetical protein
MGDERDDAANRRRADVYSSARIGAAAALTLVLVVLLVLDVAGSAQSVWLRFENGRPQGFGITANDVLVRALRTGGLPEVVVIERPSSAGSHASRSRPRWSSCRPSSTPFGPTTTSSARTGRSAASRQARPTGRRPGRCPPAPGPAAATFAFATTSRMARAP